MGIKVYKVLLAQDTTPDNITSNVRYSIAGDKKIVEFTKLPSQEQGLLNHSEAVDLMLTEEWHTPLEEL